MTDDGTPKMGQPFLSNDPDSLTKRWLKSASESKDIYINVELQRLHTEQNEKKAPTIYKDWRYAHLHGQNFSKYNLEGVDFSNAKFEHCNFSSTILKDCLFTNAKFQDCEFIKADLSKCDFQNSKGVQVGMGLTCLEDSNFFNANFSQSSIIKANLKNCNFGATVLEKCRLHESDLSHSSFEKSTLQGANLSSCNVKETIFDQADLRKATLSNIKNYNQAKWIGCDIRDINPQGAYLIKRYINDENYLYEFRQQSRYHSKLYTIWKLTSDCGRSFTRWLSCLFLMSLIFAILFYFADLHYGPEKSFITSFYFSWVTLTTLGYGDILPVSSYAQILVIAEVFLGFCGLGGLMSIFTNKMARRAE